MENSDRNLMTKLDIRILECGNIPNTQLFCASDFYFFVLFNPLMQLI